MIQSLALELFQEGTLRSKKEGLFPFADKALSSKFAAQSRRMPLFVPEQAPIVFVCLKVFIYPFRSCNW